MDIVIGHTAELSTILKNGYESFDLVELGAGDASKTIHILRQLVQSHANFTYVPIDISSSIIQQLESTLPQQVSGLQVKGLCGDYMEMLSKANAESNRKKVIMFLGSNIGNMEPATALHFCKRLKQFMQDGDQVLIGFDLKKDPNIVLNAYNDCKGYTSAFNLNLLQRANKELDANFNVENFKHYQTYDPLSGACKSYLVSKEDQEVSVGGRRFSFTRDEVIYMEVSQKYSIDEIAEMARLAGFTPVHHFYDSKQWFVDSVWKCC